MQLLHSEDTIIGAETEFIIFMKNINIFKFYSKSLFNFLKFYSIVYYILFIRLKGSLDNFITEYFEY